MLLNVRTFKRYQAWLVFVHLGFTLNPRFRSTGSWRLGEVTGRCGLLFWVSLYKTTHVFKDDWKIIMVTYCSKTNTSEPAFTTIINQSQKKKKWMFSRSKEELASIEDGQNSRVEKEVLLRSGWYDCVLSLVVLCLWDAKSMIVSLCTGCRKGHQKIQKRLKVSSSCSQPEYRNSLKRWALNFLYIYIHIHFHIPVYIFIFLPNLVSSWKRTLLSEERVFS